MTSAVEKQDLSAEVAQALADAERLQREQVRVEATKAAADAEYERMLEKLKAEFGIDSPAAARDLLEELERQTAAELAVVREQLDAASTDGE